MTQKKSEDGDSITNENIAARNNLIATLANQKDIFYIDINESSLCDEGALISDYTWDQVHVKAQYYPIWSATSSDAVPARAIRITSPALTWSARINLAASVSTYFCIYRLSGLAPYTGS